MVFCGSMMSGAWPQYVKSTQGTRADMEDLTIRSIMPRSTALNALRRSTCKSHKSCPQAPCKMWCTPLYINYVAPCTTTPSWNGRSCCWASFCVLQTKSLLTSLRRTSPTAIGLTSPVFFENERSRAENTGPRYAGIFPFAQSDAKRAMASIKFSSRAASPHDSASRMCDTRRPDGPGAEYFGKLDRAFRTSCLEKVMFSRCVCRFAVEGTCAFG